MLADVTQCEHTSRSITGRKEYFMHKWRDWAGYFSTQCGSSNGIIECPTRDIKQLDLPNIYQGARNLQTYLPVLPCRLCCYFSQVVGVLVLYQGVQVGVGTLDRRAATERRCILEGVKAIMPARRRRQGRRLRCPLRRIRRSQHCGDVEGGLWRPKLSGVRREIG